MVSFVVGIETFSIVLVSIERFDDVALRLAYFLLTKRVIPFLGI